MSVIEILGGLTLIVVVGLAVGHAFGVVKVSLDVDTKNKK